jgi:hypothetical protein
MPVGSSVEVQGQLEEKGLLKEHAVGRNLARVPRGGEKGVAGQVGVCEQTPLSPAFPGSEAIRPSLLPWTLRPVAQAWQLGTGHWWLVLGKDRAECLGGVRVQWSH